MNWDHVLVGIFAFAGGLTAKWLNNRTMAKFIKDHLDGIYRRIGSIERAMNITPSPFPSTDLPAEPISGRFPSLK